mgnify:CR=1 FL=1
MAPLLTKNEMIEEGLTEALLSGVLLEEDAVATPFVEWHFPTLAWALVAWAKGAGIAGAYFPAAIKAAIQGDNPLTPAWEGGELAAVRAAMQAEDLSQVLRTGHLAARALPGQYMPRDAGLTRKGELLWETSVSLTLGRSPQGWVVRLEGDHPEREASVAEAHGRMPVRDRRWIAGPERYAREGGSWARRSTLP